MATLSEIPVSKLYDQARSHQVHAGRGIITVIAWIFVALGWTAGILVTGVIFAAISVRYGYWRGRGLTDAEIEARVAPKPQPAGGRA